MSQAFVKENDDQWLHEIAPTLDALIHYLTRENNGIRAYEKKRYFDAGLGKDVFIMNDGMSYSINDEGRWYIIDL